MQTYTYTARSAAMPPSAARPIPSHEVRDMLVNRAYKEVIGHPTRTLARREDPDCIYITESLHGEIHIEDDRLQRLLDNEAIGLVIIEKHPEPVANCTHPPARLYTGEYKDPNPDGTYTRRTWLGCLDCHQMLTNDL